MGDDACRVCRHAAAVAAESAQGAQEAPNQAGQGWSQARGLCLRQGLQQSQGPVFTHQVPALLLLSKPW